MTEVENNGAGSQTVLRDRYRIYKDSPLPEFATGTAQAFAADDQRTPGESLVALLVNPGIPFRIDALRVLRGISSAGMMTLADYGAIHWQPYGRSVMALIYERPTGGRLTAAMNGEIAPFASGELIKKFLTPASKALREMARFGIVHRGIRPTNLYWRGAERDLIVLGDCAAAPPGFDQPPLVETIESALCQPAGRGNGSPADDLYALGATALMLLLGRNPLPGASPQQIVQAKLAEGSFAALAGRENLPIQVIEVFRGLLNDDPAARWTHDQLERWLAGKWRTDAAPILPKRATEPFIFAGKEFFSPRELAIAFSAEWAAAIRCLREGQLEPWLRRIMGARKLADDVAAVLASRGGKDESRVADDIMLCKVCLILDRLAPLRYKSVSAMPDGLGPLLALAMANGTDVNVISEMFVHEIQSAWIETRPQPFDGADLDATFRTTREHLLKASMGDGIERALYRLNESIPCQSPLVASDFVLTVRDLLPALDAAAAKSDRKGWPIDRHIAAFVGARATFDVGRPMAEIADPSPTRMSLGVLNLLATLQLQLNQKKLLRLAEWVGGLVTPIVNGYRSKRIRTHIEHSLPAPIADGDVFGIYNLVENPEARAKDAQEYVQAIEKWQTIEAEIEEIDERLVLRDEDIAGSARSAAAAASIGLAVAASFIIWALRAG